MFLDETRVSCNYRVRAGTCFGAGPSFLLDVWIVVVVGLWLFFNNFERLKGIVVCAAPQL